MTLHRTASNKSLTSLPNGTNPFSLLTNLVSMYNENIFAIFFIFFLIRNFDNNTLLSFSQSELPNTAVYTCENTCSQSNSNCTVSAECCSQQSTSDCISKSVLYANTCKYCPSSKSCMKETSSCTSCGSFSFSVWILFLFPLLHFSFHLFIRNATAQPIQVARRNLPQEIALTIKIAHFPPVPVTFAKAIHSSTITCVGVN